MFECLALAKYFTTVIELSTIKSESGGGLEGLWKLAGLVRQRFCGIYGKLPKTGPLVPVRGNIEQMQCTKVEHDYYCIVWMDVEPVNVLNTFAGHRDVVENDINIQLVNTVV